MCFVSKIEFVNEKVEGSFPFLLETNRYYLILPLIINKEEENKITKRTRLSGFFFKLCRKETF